MKYIQNGVGGGGEKRKREKCLGKVLGLDRERGAGAGLEEVGGANGRGAERGAPLVDPADPLRAGLVASVDPHTVMAVWSRGEHIPNYITYTCCVPIQLLRQHSAIVLYHGYGLSR